MDFGIVMFPTADAIQPADLGRSLEERGFESYWAPEHTHIPVSRRSPWPGGPNMPAEYARSYDPFLALTAVAAATTELRVGTGVCLVVERDPITLAKEVATLDQLCGGRFLFGVGGGWNIEEMENHGTNPKTRMRLLRERVLAMKAIWTQDEAEFHGELVSFDKIWSWPKPLQRPHPPVLLGGDGATTFDRIVEFGDGWIPITRPGQNPLERLPELRRRLEEAGRDPASVPISIFFAPPEAAALANLSRLGVSRAIFPFPPEPRDAALRRLDTYAQVMRSVS
jgi:probable F420-dependent oxidoreductase